MKKRRDSNRPFAIIAYVFIGLFLAMIAYFAYFQIVKSESFINNSYNTRLDTFAERVRRGTIVSNDGTILAQTVVDKNGEETRDYPKGRLYAHVVGYTANGKAGIESAYDFELLRSHSFLLTRIKNEIEGKKNDGDTIVTSLDDKLQRAAYEALGDKKGAVVVIEPDTGKILAMVSKPDYDPNTIEENWESILEDSKEESVLLNRATQGLYPPGSMFKLVTALEYIREHRANYKNYSYDCTGSITAEDYTLHCFQGAVHGTVDLEGSIAKSCNSSLANIGLSLDIGSYQTTAKQLLFNTQLPLRLPSSKSSFTLSSDATDSDIMATAIGQADTLVSPLHMAMLAAAIENDGYLMEPYFVDRIESADGSLVREYEPTAYKRLMKKKEARILRQLLRSVVTDGTAGALMTDSYKAAGKTGSAEYGTNKGDSHAWFMGYAKVKGKGTIALAVVVEGAGNGGSVAVPIAKTLFDTYSK